jgi:hypothetical protein
MYLSGLRLVSSQLRRPTHSNTIISPDQGVYASNRQAETKIGGDVLRLELDRLAANCTSRRDCFNPNDSRGNPVIVPVQPTK